MFLFMLNDKRLCNVKWDTKTAINSLQEGISVSCSTMKGMSYHFYGKTEGNQKRFLFRLNKVK
jgi:hypothetical protein